MVFMNKTKNHWIEGLVAGLASFLVIWIVMLGEIKLGLILIDIPFTEYLSTSLFSALFMGTIVGLLFAYTQKLILFENPALRGIAFLGLFELLSIATLFLIPSSLARMMDIYASIFAFVIDVSLTVIIGGCAIGMTYNSLVKKKVFTNKKKHS